MENMMQINIEIQDHTGDRKLTLNWEPGDKEAEEHMEAMFYDLQKAGYRFYSVKRVLGIFKKKEEVTRYDPALGELIYKKSKKQIDKPLNEVAPVKQNQSDIENKEVTKAKEESEKSQGSLKMYEAEKEKKAKYEDHKKYNPEKESLDTSRDYVATKKMRAG
ncbi:hypothetical protein [Bacillus thuringiensis]|uniref:hypothetical protein n=1 Tax=Bacillus thuringiensis TaxID=1428 RepID=UPI0021D651BD|nr:hypothetical protein [Bacillus thuringiensis]MCU7666828.1 hypothetical protein [Bacillus thuringiensis]